MRPTQTLRGGGGSAPVGKHGKLVIQRRGYRPVCAFSRALKEAVSRRPGPPIQCRTFANSLTAFSGTGATLVSELRSEAKSILKGMVERGTRFHLEEPTSSRRTLQATGETLV